MAGSFTGLFFVPVLSLSTLGGAMTVENCGAAVNKTGRVCVPDGALLLLVVLVVVVVVVAKTTGDDDGTAWGRARPPTCRHVNDDSAALRCSSSRTLQYRKRTNHLIWER